jgi:hypothetical protein
MKIVRAAAFAFVAAASAWAHAAAPATADPGAALLARYAVLEEGMRHNSFGRPLHLDSREGTEGVAGEIYALVDSAFAPVSVELARPSQWCAIMSLHLNTKFCRAASEAGVATLQVRIGEKFDQPVADAYPLDFIFRVTAEAADYLQVRLDAAEGPLGTSNYLIMLEAAPAGDGRTVIHLAYSYSYGLVAQLAMQVYLATTGRNKVGFTVVGKDADGGPRYIRGMRGVVERNTMRYYLAIESFIGALAAPVPARVETSMRAWFAAIEGYPRQLHEMEEADYLAMKRREQTRQR